jgi:hypothetical protein
MQVNEDYVKAGPRAVTLVIQERGISLTSVGACAISPICSSSI